MRDHVVDGPLPRPAERVQPRIDDQPDRAPVLRRQHPQPIELARVQLHLVRQLLGIECPAVGVAGVGEVAAQRVDILPLDRQRHLQVVARQRLVERRRLVIRARDSATGAVASCRVCVMTSWTMWFGAV